MRNNNTRESVTSSNLGHFPKDWNSFYLDELGNTNSPTIKAGPFGSSLTKSTYVAFGYKVYGQEQVIRNDELWGDYFVSDDKFKELKTCEVLPGDILLSLVGTAGKLLVISTLAPKGIINPRLLRFRFAPDKLNSQFFKYLFESDIIQNYLSSNAQGGTMAVLNAGMLKTLEITIPRIAEQTAIANALSDVDALIVELEKLIAKKQAIKTATMQQLLTGRTRLPEFANHPDGTPKGYKQTELGEIPDDWEVIRLGEASTFINGRAYALHEWESSGTPVIRLQNLTGRGDGYYFSNLTLPDKQYCEKGDLLFMWSATFGPVIWQGEKAIYHYHIWKIESAKKFSKIFLFHLLDDMTEKLKRGSSSGGTMLHVTKEKMESTKAVFPTFEEQAAIANILSDMDEEIQSLQQRLDKTSKIKQGMMQELLTGKTRLV